MAVSRRSIAVVGASVLVATVVAAQTVQARVPVAVPFAQGEGQCSVVWKKAGVTFKALSEGKDATSYPVTDGTGTVNIDLALIGDVTALAKSISVVGSVKGGFRLTDAEGHFVEISDPEGTLPLGGSSYIVKTNSSPEGVRTPVYTYAGLPELVPTVSSVVPPVVGVELADAQLNLTPEFARILNDAFGAGSAQEGTLFGSCAGTILA
ncbi:hypothetical protein I5Q34_25900 [Streptomyces sp. AV19]|uniref:hypothetical protein n=1 Tax=Streptomyces sp. AV19 TaxID=2793068 RepID=UPI0018FEA724|nr:hypothetical protein [Streptomyces sp. AV19]MBH1937663.1 hypothetical protein [Streptomyces sp. AV19]MDG4536330.1 hypothetical protein [Streptomyces sp. AV19]